MQRLPDFLIIGAAKCGTTSLHQQLNQHPDIYFPAIKEPTFFSEHGVGTWHKGIDWYSSLFADAQANQLTGEASTSYSKAFWYGDAPEKIHQLIPQAKLIYLIRDPIDQIISHYLHIRYDELDTRTLDERLLGDDFLLKVASYAYQLEQFLPFYTKQQIHIIRLDDYIDHNALEMQKLYEFLSIDRHITQLQRKNSRRKRLLLRWDWLKYIPSIAHLTPFERQRRLPHWLLKPQLKIQLTVDLESKLKELLKPDVYKLKSDWGVCLPGW